MRVMAQVAMVMALDKCIGCHTCSVTCKQAWTNRAGTEYVWFNNVETRPGQGYPRRYEDQEKWKGGWVLNKRGRLELKSGNRFQKLFTIFASPIQPELNDYYEPWTYDYQNLTSAPLGDDFPAAKPVSLITGEDTKVEWGMNWDDNLAGATEYGHLDPLVEKVRKKAEDKIKFEFEQTFMFYLPRICEHCLNPSCMASCPSGAIYKRAEDGIVLVDQDRCRGWRQCITGCPYKKVYFNHKTGKAEKCTFCYPRIEAGIPTVCAETCVGRMRYIGIFLYDADRVTEAASVEDEKDLYEAQLSLMLDPSDPAVIEQARKNDIPDAWITAAQKSPVYKLAKEWKVALPLHPEYRTMPMVCTYPRCLRLLTCSRSRATMRRTATTCSVLLSLSVFRLSTLLSCSPQATLRLLLTFCAAWLRCVRTCVISTSVARQRRDCSGCWYDRSAGVRDVPPDGYR